MANKADTTLTEVSDRQARDALEQRHFDPSTEPDPRDSGDFTGAAPGK